MTPETIFLIIVVIVTANFLLGRYLDYINLKNQNPELPPEADGIYDKDSYAKSQKYLKTKENFAVIASVFSFFIILILLFFDGFAFIDGFIKNFSQNEIILTLLFFGILGFGSDIIGIPFDIYFTFVIEKKFNFNKTTPKIYITDKIKMYLLSLIIGGGLIAVITWIYTIFTSWFWLIALIVITLFSVFMNMFYTQLIVPLFNKLTPLPDGELRDAISNFANKVKFSLKEISVIDSSKRSTKSNAYFSGLGKYKRIVLFDTLISKHSTEELVAILAHEIAHFKKKHIIQGLLIGIVQTAFLLFLLSVFLKVPVFQYALNASETSFYFGILVFGLLYSPVSLVLHLLSNYISRKNEFEADKFAGENYSAKVLAKSLKKLSSDNLSNLTPHPLYVFFNYSHPPLLERIKSLDKINSVLS